MRKWLFIMMLLVSFKGLTQERTIFQTPDSLVITADLYAPHPETSPFIILFHQAGWSRGEYLEIAPKLNALGYNCLAVDQRAGGSINSVLNESHKRAKEQNLKFAFIDAETDMITAIDYIKKRFSKAEQLIIWGSSYSASLVLKLQQNSQGLMVFWLLLPGNTLPGMVMTNQMISLKTQLRH